MLEVTSCGGGSSKAPTCESSTAGDLCDKAVVRLGGMESGRAGDIVQVMILLCSVARWIQLLEDEKLPLCLVGIPLGNYRALHKGCMLYVNIMVLSSPRH